MNVLHLNSKRKYQDSITDSRHFFIKYFYNIKAYENKLYIWFITNLIYRFFTLKNHFSDKNSLHDVIFMISLAYNCTIIFFRFVNI